jgi:SOS response regulatory protein OraA/RecX
MAGVLALTDKLEAELPTMLAEHEEIVGALGELVAAATAEKKLRYARFAEKLIRNVSTRMGHGSAKFRQLPPVRIWAD